MPKLYVNEIFDEVRRINHGLFAHSAMLGAAGVAKTTVTLMLNFVAMNLEANGMVPNPDFGVMWVV